MHLDILYWRPCCWFDYQGILGSLAALGVSRQPGDIRPLAHDGEDEKEMRRVRSCTAGGVGPSGALRGSRAATVTAAGRSGAARGTSRGGLVALGSDQPIMRLYRSTRSRGVGCAGGNGTAHREIEANKNGKGTNNVMQQNDGQRRNSAHGLLALLLGIPLAGHGQFGIHQGAAGGLEVHIIQAGSALGEGKHR